MLAPSSRIARACRLFHSAQRGIRRDDIRPGLRVTNYKKRAVIAFDVAAERVSIIGVFYGGQDYETALPFDLDD